MNPDLAIVWACILAFGVFAYVVMDGFDLGVGILFPTLKPGVERDIAMNSIAPVWDGNETWLVLGGGGLMAAFPLAYAILLPALYAPITAMLLGYWILGERITRQEIFGALVIGSALVVMDGRVFDLFRRRQPARPSE